MGVEFFNERIRFNFSSKGRTSEWLTRVVESEGGQIVHLNIIFCSDGRLRKLNMQYLGHDYNTDVLAFDHGGQKMQVEADVYVSVQRVRANSRQFSRPFREELHRVIVHGLLHILNYSDKSEAEKVQMREKEDTYLSLLTGGST